MGIEQALADGLNSILNGNDTQNPKVGFVLLLFPFGDGLDPQLCNYVSNAQRHDVVALLKEMTARFEGQPYMSGKA